MDCVSDKIEAGAVVRRDMNSGLPNVDDTQDRPSGGEIAKMWENLVVRRGDIQSEAIDKLLFHLRDVFRGGDVQFANFNVTLDPVMDWFASRGQLKFIDFIPTFLSRPNVSNLLLEQGLAAARSDKFEIHKVSAFTFAGELAALLKGGGLTQCLFQGSDLEAKLIAEGFCHALFDDRPSEIEMFYSQAAWCSWSGGNPLNMTWFGIDQRTAQVWLLAITETD